MKRKEKKKDLKEKKNNIKKEGKIKNLCAWFPFIRILVRDIYNFSFLRFFFLKLVTLKDSIVTALSGWLFLNKSELG